MKKTIFLSGVICLFTSIPAGAQPAQPTFGQTLISAISQEYPSRNRYDNNANYWHQLRIERERERAQEEARQKDAHDRGHHYAYGKNHKKHHGKASGKNHPKKHSKSHDDKHKENHR
jgi:hypothetical protein